MTRLSRILTAALSAGALAGVVFACDKDNGAQTAGAAVGAKQETAKTDGSTGCRHAQMAKSESGGGCPHAVAKTELAEYKDTSGGCPFHSKASETQLAALTRGEKVTMVGEVVCASCDLKQAQNCKSVFRTAEGKTWTIIGNDAFEKLASLTKHGEKKVEVEATTAVDASEPIVLLHSYKVLG